MTILVTGGAGFIGSHFVRYVLNLEPELQVINVDKLTYAGNLETILDLLDHSRHKFIKADIADTSTLSSIFRDHNPSMIFNFAAESHVDRSILDPFVFMETNVIGTHRLLEQARLIPKTRFIQISTDEVYGSLGEQGHFTENSPLAPNSPYSASKASADLLVRSYHHTFALDTVVTRCSNNYGPYQFPEKLIPLMIRNARSNQTLPVYGDGLNVRDWIHVSDHVRGIWLAGLKGKSGEVYNFGSNNEWTNIEIVRLILNVLKKPETLIRHVEDRPGHDRRYAIDASKALAELGWEPQISFSKGINETIAWYASNDHWLNNVLSGDYRNFFERWYASRLSPEVNV